MGPSEVSALRLMLSPLPCTPSVNTKIPGNLVPVAVSGTPQGGSLALGRLSQTYFLQPLERLSDRTVTALGRGRELSDGTSVFAI
jgi:hypothetical protein